jgi:hypothetical protein
MYQIDYQVDALQTFYKYGQVMVQVLHVVKTLGAVPELQLFS